MKQPIPVVAVIPNYNMADELERLLPELITQSYDGIYVCDDASTDRSESVALQYPSVTWLANGSNTGAGGARNLILHHFKRPVLLHFLDADVDLITRDSPSVVRRVYSESPASTGLTGGLVADMEHRQSPWNYGAQQSLSSSISAFAQSFLTTIGNRWPQYEVWLRRHLRWPWLRERPDRTRPAKARKTYWVLEANMVILSTCFDEVGGFDPAIREHDIQPLAAKLHEAGYSVRFTPELEVRHRAVNVRSYNRWWRQLCAEWYVVRRYLGFWRWLTGLSRANKRT